MAEGKALESFILTITEPGSIVLPLRISLALSPGSGVLHAGGIKADGAWLDSIGCAWAEALRLTGRADVDGTVTVAGRVSLQGPSAGLSLSLLAIAALLGEPGLPPHFATGQVLPGGRLAGGAALRPKLAAAAAYAPQLRMAGPVFLSPPVEPAPPCPPGIRLLHAADLASAYAALLPGGGRLTAALDRAPR